MLRPCASIPVGLDPVSVRARSNDEVWVVNHVSDSVSIVDLERCTWSRHAPTPTTSPATSSSPAAPERAFVSCSQANTRARLRPGEPRRGADASIAIDGEDPRALAVSPTARKVYAAIFESGNGTTILGGGGGGRHHGFPPNVVSDPAGPYGGVNPPPEQRRDASSRR